MAPTPLGATRRNSWTASSKYFGVVTKPTWAMYLDLRRSTSILMTNSAH